MTENPYASPEAVGSPEVTPGSNNSRHWFVVHATAWAMIGISVLNLLNFLRIVIAWCSGTIPPDEIDRPIQLLIVPGVATITIAGAIGALQRRRWGVGLLAVMTCLHCCLTMLFGLGDSFSACWRSFDSTTKA